MDHSSRLLVIGAITTLALLTDKTASVNAAPISKPDRPCPLARQLSWKSLTGDRIGFLLLWPEGEAAESLWKMGPRAAACLASVLEDPERGVAAHVILTNIYHRDRIAPQVRYITAKGNPKKFIAITQTINGLTWTYDTRRQKYTVKLGDLHQNALRWRRELKL